MNDYLVRALNENPLWGLFLTLAAYQAGLWLYQRCGRPVLLHPVAVGAVLITAALKLLPVSYADYQSANQLFYLLLGPATVALAVPLHQEFHHIRRLAGPVLLTILAGGAFAAASAVAIAWLLDATPATLISLSPKSVTTPIALGVADKLGALSGLTTGVVVFTGVIGTLMSPYVFRLLRLDDRRLQGIVLGLNAHGVGTARAFEISPACGAFAGLAMGLTGACTAFTLPYVVTWLRGFL